MSTTYTIHSATWGQIKDVSIDPITGEETATFRTDPTVLRLNVEFDIEGERFTEVVDICPYVDDADVHRQLRGIVEQKLKPQPAEPTLELGTEFKV